MAIINRQISASFDDAYRWDNDGMTKTRDQMIISVNKTAPPGHPSTQNLSFLRFLNITIPQGATIINATIEGYAWRSSGDPDYNNNMYCEAADNSQTLVDIADLVGRPITTAVSQWNESNVPVNTFHKILDIGGGVHNLSAAVQEVISRAGWVSGNAITFIGRPRGNANGRFRTWDFNNSLAAKLEIIYKAAQVIGPMFI